MGVEEEGGEALVAEEGKGSVGGPGGVLCACRYGDKRFVSQQVK